MNSAYVKKVRRGFTLIELLVVIAIIGLLSAVVLASLSSARLKGKDASIRSNLLTVQNQAALYWENNSNYGTAYANAAGSPGTCPTTAAAGYVFRSDANTLSAIMSSYGLSPQATHPEYENCVGKVPTDKNSYAIAVRLNNPSDTWYCVDSQGARKVLTGYADYLNLRTAFGSGSSPAKCP
ncbi:MAG: type II secretion system protein [Minisyncoccia bacterium]